MARPRRRGEGHGAMTGPWAKREAGGPPPDAVILAVSGLQGPPEQRAAMAAIAAADPSAQSWVDGARGLLAVRSGLGGRALVAALRRAGFRARVQGGRRHGVLGVLLRVVLYTVGGIALGLLVGVLFGMGNSLFNPECTRPGSSGNCAIGVGVFGALGALLGAPLGLIAGLVAGLAGRR
jgi:hypothetical protein